MIVAFWILLVPKLLPASLESLPFFRRRYALASGGAAVFTLFLINVPQPSLLSAFITSITGVAVTEAMAQTLGWLLVVVFIIGIGLGVSPWLKARPVTASVIASACVVVGMWLERWNIIIPTMTHPHLIFESIYQPTFTELSLTSASLALFALMFLVFFKLFPAVSIWEVAEGRVIEEAKSKITIPAPEPTEVKRMRRWGIKH
jgi:Ni/Fe-hydrogenase subunit HybB-like protein